MSQERTLDLLLVEDNPTDALLVKGMLSPPGRVRFEVTHVATLEAALKALGQASPDLILLDLNLPDESSETLRVVHAAAPTIPIVVATADEEDELAYKALHQGAEDFIVKGSLAPKQLARVLAFAVERRELKNQIREVEDLLQATKNQRLATEKEQIRTRIRVHVQSLQQALSELAPHIGDNGRAAFNTAHTASIDLESDLDDI